MSQHTFKALALGAVLGFMASVVPSCSAPAPTCGPSNCLTGCCNANKCVTATNGNNTTCGTAGLSCVDCTKTTGSTCTSSFKCSGTGTGGGAGGSGGGTGTGGGTAGGAGGGTTLTCAQTCATGCCDATGNCQLGTSNTACGTGAAACASCASPATCVGNVCKDTTCANCTKNGVCQTALSDTTCGKGGVTCLDCAAAGGATCNTTTGVCAGGTCPSGCRDAAGACVAGNTNGACGTTGGACTACTGTNVCTNGACVASGTGGGAGGSGGGGSGGTCSGGAPCSNGCCSGTVCIAPTFQSATNCGLNAAACAPCQSGQLCTAGVCGGGGTGGGAGGGTGGGTGGGAPAGVLGAACTLDSDCTGVTVTAAEAAEGYKAFCKKTLNPVGLPYPGGMCTRRCIPTSANPSPCGTAGFCDYLDGPYGEIDNICLPTCSATAPCRTQYKCYQYSSTTSACYPANPDGSDIGPFDAGPGNMGNVAGGPCTSDTQCAPQTPPPALGFCLSPTAPDGGPSGFLDGQCSAQCNFSLSDAWCGTSGACNPYIGGATATGPAIVFLCQQECTGADAGITSTCRTGYFCNAATNGNCSPRCDNPGATCAAGKTCNTTTGACQ